jgi:hypothetical protein
MSRILLLLAAICAVIAWLEWRKREVYVPASWDDEPWGDV